MLELQKDENVLLVLRRHKLTLALELSIILILAVIIWVVLAYIKNNNPEILAGYFSLIWFGLSVYYLFLWLKLFLLLSDYYLDVSIITTKRIMDIDQVRLFHRQLAECPLERVQDVSVKVAGPLQTLLDFGDVIIRTASDEQSIILEQIPSPYKVKDSILQMLNQKLSRSNHEQAGTNL
ncbi:PH domain-containing protein [Candidatus Parcubacteria bacterium]|nr:MAG: PH domain-containing protein [Candidatus Parcubacteria bacterium]